MRSANQTLAEQHRIVAKVDDLMALCDRMEAGLAATDGTRSRLLESLLHDALAPPNFSATMMHGPRRLGSPGLPRGFSFRGGRV